MRVALIVPGFSQHDADWAIPVLQNLAVALAHEHQVEIFSLRYPAAGRYQVAGLSHCAIGGGQRFGLASIPIWWHAVAAIRQRHRQAPFDILHAFWADEPGFVGALAGRFLHRPVITTIGGGELTFLPEINYGTQGSAVRRTIVRLAMSAAEMVTAGSKYQCDLALAHGLDTNKLHQVPLGIDLTQFFPLPTPEWQRPTLLQAASLTPVKNQSLLLSVLARVRDRLPAIRLIVAGDGPLADGLLQQAEEMGLEKSIVWLSAWPHIQMPRFYGQGHLYIQSSLHESQGVAVLEALACGLPVLGTPVGLMAEVAARPANGSPELLADQIFEIMSDRLGYELLRSQSRQLAEGRFSLGQTVARFGSLYQQLARS